MTQEKLHWHLNGIAAWVGLFLLLATIVFSLASLGSLLHSLSTGGLKDPAPFYLPIATLVVSFWLLTGFTVIQPNEALVLVFVGSYSGTVKNNGLVLVNPFCSRKRITLKLQNLHSDILKVNDKRGNPIEIGAVIVWQVAEPAKAIFDVDNYLLFVKIQSEAAVRHLANMYSYDSDEEEHTLRSGIDEVSQALKEELNQRLATAGISISEALVVRSSTLVDSTSTLVVSTSTLDVSTSTFTVNPSTLVFNPATEPAITSTSFSILSSFLLSVSLIW